MTEWVYVLYEVVSAPHGVVATGTSAPIVVSGLDNDTSYTFTVVATGALASPASAPSNEVTPRAWIPAGSFQVSFFDCAGSAEPWSVPTGVSSIAVDMAGASGRGSAAEGGLGGRVEATVDVESQADLVARVGCLGNPFDGSAGFNGGGLASGLAGPGGGATDIRTAGDGLADRIVVAGGGGGGSRDSDGPGGDGGGLVGGNGAAGSGAEPGGKGGTGAAGGAGGCEAGGTNCGDGRRWRRASAALPIGPGSLTMEGRFR